MKLVNPLHYPLAVFLGGIVLVLGVRLGQLPNFIILPTAAAIATGGAIFLNSKRTVSLNIDNPALVQEIQSVQQQAKLLAQKAEALRTEAKQLLADSSQLELLVAIEYACDRTGELPAKIDRLVQRLQGSDSLLSVTELQQQLTEVKTKKSKSSGVARQQLERLAIGLENNLKLARQGQDARQAQVISLATLAIESAGILQQLQNRLRTANLEDNEEIQELKSQIEELKSRQESVDILVTNS
jgi:hypothetical protein